MSEGSEIDGAAESAAAAELAGLTGPSGLEPGEKVPNQVRIMASQHSLGTLLSVHRPSSRLARIQFRNGRVYCYDQGIVLCQSDGARLKLFRVGQMRIKNSNDRTFLLAGPNGQAGFVTSQWTGGEELAGALSRWASAAS